MYEFEEIVEQGDEHRKDKNGDDCPCGFRVACGSLVELLYDIGRSLGQQLLNFDFMYQSNATRCGYEVEGEFGWGLSGEDFVKGLQLNAQ